MSSAVTRRLARRARSRGFAIVLIAAGLNAGGTARAAPPKPISSAHAARPAVAATASVVRPAAPTALTATATATAPAPAESARTARATADDGEDEKKGYSPLGIGIVLGLVVVLGGAAAVAAKIKSSGSARPARAAEGPLVGERKHDWESPMSEADEAALLGGLTALRDSGRAMYVNQAEAMISLYRPPQLVSLYALRDAFGASGGSDPTASVRDIFARFAATEQQGVLHLRTDWYRTAIDGLTNNDFMKVCLDAVNGLSYPHAKGSYGDENKGMVQAKLEVDGPLQIFSADLARVCAYVTATRTANPAALLVGTVKEALGLMARGEMAGGMWARPPVAAEVAMLTEGIAKASARVG